MKNLFFLFMIIIMNPIFADSVTLYNDTPFELTAVVQSANGRVLAQKSMQPGEQSNWDTDQDVTQLDVDYNVQTSYTPYTVIWRCSYQGFYSVCTNVATGAIVTANACNGPRYCRPKPKKGQQGDDETACLTCPNNKTLK